MAEQSTPDLHMPAPPQSSVFFFEESLRPGWGILLAFTLFLVISRLISAVFKRYVPWYHFPRAPHLHMPLEYAPQFIALGALMAGVFVVSILEHRKMATYGYGGRNKGFMFLVGIAIGLALTSALVLVMNSMGLVTISDIQIFRWTFVRYACEHALGFLCVAMFEQSGFRGYLQYSLTRGLTFLYKAIFGFVTSFVWAFWTSAVLCGLLFVWYYSHTVGETAFGLLTAFLLSLLSAWSLWRTGNLWWAIGFNFAYNFTEAFLFGAPASTWALQDRLHITAPIGASLMNGGRVGPEGSPLFLAVIAIAAVLIALLPRSTVYPGIARHPRRQNFQMAPDPDLP